MESDNQTRELRLKGSSTILSYLTRFSATEKVVFGIFAAALIVTALVMALRANSYFMSEIPAHGGSLHEGLVGLPHTVNPVLAVTDVDRDIASLVYAGLTRNQGGKIVADLAEKWDVSPDGMTYTFTLKPNLEFHNGASLTADDVVFTINKIKDSSLKSPRAIDWAGVSVQASGPSTVVFTLKQPMSTFLSNATVGILPKSIWGNVSDEQFIFSGYNVRPVGAGPYKVGTITSDQGGIPTDYELDSWSDYAGTEAHISDITFTFFPDLDHALTALSNGSIDSLSSIPPSAAAKLAANKGEPYTIDTAALSRIFGVFLNQNKNQALTDTAIRQALSLTVDRSQIIKEVLAGYGIPVNGPVSVSAPAGSSTSDVPAALALLSKNGWKLSPNGVLEKKPAKKGQASTTISFTLYTPDTADLMQVANILKTQWAKIGISVNVISLPPADLYQNVIRVRGYDALLFGQIVSKPTDLYAFWHSSQRLAPGVNVSMYTNSKADRLLDTIRTATSTDASTSAYGQFIQTITDDIPAIFLYSPDLIYAVPKTLRGIGLTTATSPSDRFQNVTSWYTETQRVWNIFIKKVQY
ncbi:MAG TPA: ABC transporter substrate-binding protein [Candidatus Paceibacterota bacterium]